MMNHTSSTEKHHTGASGGKFASHNKHSSASKAAQEKAENALDEELDIEVDEYDLSKASHDCGCGCRSHHSHY